VLEKGDWNIQTNCSGGKQQLLREKVSQTNHSFLHITHTAEKAGFTWVFIMMTTIIVNVLVVVAILILFIPMMMGTGNLLYQSSI
jgi:hypothetical protein